MDEKKWYVVNTYSGHESKVKEKIEIKANSLGVEDQITRVVVPETITKELKDGELKEKRKKMFPGYILVEMIMTDETWYIIRNTPGVTGFIGSSGKGTKPFPLQEDEVAKILGQANIPLKEIDGNLEIGEKVKVTTGAFANLFGKISRVDFETNECEVIVDLFGQETTVELSLADIEKV